MAFSSDLHEPLEVLKGKGSSFILVPQSAFIYNEQNQYSAESTWGFG